MTMAEFEAAARAYVAAPITVEPVRSYDELIDVVEGTGLRIERLERLWLEGHAPEGAAAPGIHRSEHYARLVAVRP
jgi:hypothetical protein